MDITIAVQNLSHGGSNRWELLFERLEPVAADILILNEATAFDEEGQALAHEFADELGLHVAGVTPSKSDLPSAVLYRRDRLGEPQAWDVKHNYLIGHGLGVAVWDLDCLPAPLAIGAIHVSPFSVVQAVIEVQTLVSRAYRYGPYAIVGGDFNYPPLEGKDADIEGMLPFNKMNRLHNPRSDHPTPNRTVAQALYDGEFYDVATQVWHRTKNDDCQAYTGRTDRIDWIAASSPLRETITDYQLLNQPPAASDHHGIATTLNLAAADTSDPWGYR